MKNDARRFLLWGALAFAFLMGLGAILAWTADEAFNGLVMDGMSALVSGVSNGVVFFDKQLIARAGLIILTVFSASVCGAGTLCALRVYRAQRALLDKARADALRAQEVSRMEAQRKSDLITYLAHDLKTPLASVIAYLELLKESPELPPAQRAKYTGIALDKAGRLEQLIGELFEAIRFNLQTIELSPQNVNLKILLSQLAEEFYPIMLERGNSVTVDCPDGLTLWCDPDKMARVCNNLLKNAAAYSDAGTVVSVAATREGDNIALRFANTGALIPESKLRRIFDKFYRLDASRSTGTGGAGLGLAIAREIVEAHGGSIAAKSVPERTVFTVLMPAAPSFQPGDASDHQSREH